MRDTDDDSVLGGLTLRGRERASNARADLADLADLADQLNAIASELKRVFGGPNFSNPGSSDALSRRQIFESKKSNGSARHLDRNDMAERRRQYAANARETYAKRRRRAVVFGNPELFGEPAWDILLDLYIAYVEEKPVSVSSACIGSAAPPTTGLRWLGVLAEQELILREHDPEDQRRVLVKLSETGLQAMDEYFASTDAPI